MTAMPFRSDTEALQRRIASLEKEIAARDRELDARDRDLAALDLQIGALPQSEESRLEEAIASARKESDVVSRSLEQRYRWAALEPRPSEPLPTFHPLFGLLLLAAAVEALGFVVAVVSRVLAAR
jgi:hypothetical protein